MLFHSFWAGLAGAGRPLRRSIRQHEVGLSRLLVQSRASARVRTSLESDEDRRIGAAQGALVGGATHRGPARPAARGAAPGSARPCRGTRRPALADRALDDGRLPYVKLDVLRHDPYGLDAGRAARPVRAGAPGGIRGGPRLPRGHRTVLSPPAGRGAAARAGGRPAATAVRGVRPCLSCRRCWSMPSGWPRSAPPAPTTRHRTRCWSRTGSTPHAPGTARGAAASSGTSRTRPPAALAPPALRGGRARAASSRRPPAPGRAGRRLARARRPRPGGRAPVPTRLARDHAGQAPRAGAGLADAGRVVRRERGRQRGAAGRGEPGPHRQLAARGGRAGRARAVAVGGRLPRSHRVLAGTVARVYGGRPVLEHDGADQFAAGSRAPRARGWSWSGPVSCPTPRPHSPWPVCSTAPSAPPSRSWSTGRGWSPAPAASTAACCSPDTHRGTRVTWAAPSHLDRLAGRGPDPGDRRSGPRRTGLELPASAGPHASSSRGITMTWASGGLPAPLPTARTRGPRARPVPLGPRHRRAGGRRGERGATPTSRGRWPTPSSGAASGSPSTPATRRARWTRNLDDVRAGAARARPRRTAARAGSTCSG